MESFSILLSLCFCLCTISLKGQLTQKFKFFHQLSALMSFQTRKTLVLLRNTIEDIWMKPGRFLYSENTFASAEISHARSLKNQHACVSCWRERPLSRYSGTRKRRAKMSAECDFFLPVWFFFPVRSRINTLVNARRRSTQKRRYFVNEEFAHKTFVLLHKTEIKPLGSRGLLLRRL